ncbi:MAG: EamA-like transporter family protein [Chlamydiota bacterium]|jgi:hypothetical protein|nr:EamA-like transporter family protein [Chlamydiota bacterium]
MGLIIVRSLARLLFFLFLAGTGPPLIPFVPLIYLKIPINHKLWSEIVYRFLGILFILKPGKETI